MRYELSFISWIIQRTLVSLRQRHSVPLSSNSLSLPLLVMDLCIVRLTNLICNKQLLKFVKSPLLKISCIVFATWREGLLTLPGSGGKWQWRLQSSAFPPAPSSIVRASTAVTHSLPTHLHPCKVYFISSLSLDLGLCNICRVQPPTTPSWPTAEPIAVFVTPWDSTTRGWLLLVRALTA
jgi:hypothetical protein